MNSTLENIRVGDIIIAGYGAHKQRLCEVARKDVVGKTFVSVLVYDDSMEGCTHSVENQSISLPTEEQIATFLAFKESQKVYFACKAALVLAATKPTEKKNCI